MAATQAIAFLNTIGAKKPNLYTRVGRKARLTFVLKGKTHAVDVEEHDLDSGAEAIPKIRQIVANVADQRSLAAKTIAADEKFATGGGRLKYAREEATLTRTKLAEATGIEVATIKVIEDKKLEFDGRVTDDQLIAIANACKTVDPNWLAGREIVAPAEPAPEQQPVAVPAFDLDAFLATPIPPEEYAAIGERIREARNAAGLSQVNVGKELGVAGVTLLNVEKGRPSKLWDDLPKIARLINVSAYRLRTGQDVPVAPEPEPTPEPAAAEPVVEQAGPIGTTAHPVFDQPNYAEIGDRIRTARVQKDLNQTNLGDLLGVNANVISQAENGRNNVIMHMLDEVAEHLDCSEEWLDSGTGRPPPGVRVPPGPGLVKAGETRSTPQPAVEIRRPAMGRPAARPAAEPQTSARVVAGDPLNGLWKHLDQRLDQMQEMARLRHEEMRLLVEQITKANAQTADVLRYVRAVYKLLTTKVEPALAAAKNGAKNPRRVAAGHQAWRTRTQEPTPREVPPEEAAELQRFIESAEGGFESKPEAAAEAAPDPIETDQAEADPIVVMARELLDEPSC